MSRCDERRFWGTVPETDVLVVTHKRRVEESIFVVYYKSKARAKESI